MSHNQFSTYKFNRKREFCRIDFGYINEIVLSDCKVYKKQKTLHIQGDAFNARRLSRDLKIVGCLQLIIIFLWIYRYFIA